MDPAVAGSVSVVFALLGVAVPAFAETPFTNEAVARGVNYTLGANFQQWGAGVAFVDLDNDGDADLIATGAASGLVGVYENNGSGQFINRSAASGIAAMTKVSSVSAADYDGDGDEDLHITRFLGFADRLYRNDGGFHFTDVSAVAGIAVDGPGTASCWGDFNGDGWLDLYVCYYTGTQGSPVQNHLFRNNGDGTFTDVAVELGVHSPDDPTLVATFFDFDFDGDADLYLGTDKGAQAHYINHLFRNDGGVFTEITYETGTEGHIDTMGIAYGDIDHNGKPDLFMSSGLFGHALLMASADGAFYTDQAEAAGVQVFAVGWSCVFFDYDNDTWEDLFVVHAASENTLFRNPGSFPFTDVSAAMGVNDGGNSYICAIADIDLDGDLDLISTRELAPLRLYINHEGEQHNWVRLKVMGTGHNLHAIGAQAWVTRNGLTQFREVRAGCNYKADNERQMHFGLGDDPSVIDRIEVRWPNSTVRRTLRNYPPNHHWTVWHPSRLGDADGNGSIDASDIALAVGVMNAHAGGPIDPGEEVFDMDGDCDVDISDIASMLARYARPAVSDPTGLGAVRP